MGNYLWLLLAGCIYTLLMVKGAFGKDRVGMKWRCHCSSWPRVSSSVVRCYSYGVEYPSSLHEESNSSIFWSFSSEVSIDIVKNCFLPHNTTLKEVSITRMKYLDEFDKQSFENLQNIEAITLSKAPALRFLPVGIFFPVGKSLRVLRVTHTGLESLPNLPGLVHNIMHILDFESNRIKMIKSNSFHLQTEQLILDYNDISVVEGWAFNGSRVAKLSLRGNWALNELSTDAFRGLHSLRELDLSETSIDFLPVLGLESLEVLRLEDTPTLKIIPSIYEFKNLHTASLTYSFHCCAFQFPARHDPARHELHQEFIARVKQLCIDNNNNEYKNAMPVVQVRELPRSRRMLEFGGFGQFVVGDGGNTEAEMNENKGMHAITNSNIGTQLQNYSEIIIYPNSETQKAENTTGVTNAGSWRKVAPIQTSKFQAFCGNITLSRPPVTCTPIPDAFNPCEDIMGYKWLRYSVWLVISMALFGNVAVLIVLLANRSDLTVTRFLIMNLAFSDLLMAVYLLLLATTDIRSTGIYFNYALSWQMGAGCMISGALTVFSSQLSIYTLTLITIERWFAIKNALYTNIIDLKVSFYAMGAGWAYSIVMAMLPLFGISSYSTTSICLPMDIDSGPSFCYVITLLLVNGIAFIVICICYIQIYLSLGKETRHCPGESSVARKMMLLVGTNFACCAPIAFFSLTAVAGYPFINVRGSKVLLVFFYPINSCANPYLYAIMTSQYRKQLVQLLSRWGICTKWAESYKMVYSPNDRKTLSRTDMLLSGRRVSEDILG